MFTQFTTYDLSALSTLRFVHTVSALQTVWVHIYTYCTNTEQIITCVLQTLSLQSQNRTVEPVSDFRQHTYFPSLCSQINIEHSTQYVGIFKLSFLNWFGQWIHAVKAMTGLLLIGGSLILGPLIFTALGRRLGIKEVKFLNLEPIVF